MHYTIIFLGYCVSDFVGNSHAWKINNTQTKQANITDIALQYNSWVSTGSGVNSALYFLLVSICDKSHLFTVSTAASSRHCWRGLPLIYCVQYAVQYTVSAAVIQLIIRWAGHLSIDLYFAWYWSIGAAVVVLMSKTLLKFSRPIRLCLSSCVSDAVILIVLFLFYHTNLPPHPSPVVYFVVPTVPPLCHISYYVSIALHTHHILHWFTDMPLLLSQSSSNCLPTSWLLCRCLSMCSCVYYLSPPPTFIPLPNIHLRCPHLTRHLLFHCHCHIRFRHWHYFPAFTVPYLLSPPPFIFSCHRIEPMLSLPLCDTNVIHFLMHYDLSDIISLILFTILVMQRSLFSSLLFSLLFDLLTILLSYLLAPIF